MRTLFMPDELYELLRREKARQDRDEDRDERNHWIELRSKATSYRVMFWMNAAWMIGPAALAPLSISWCR